MSQRIPVIVAFLLICSTCIAQETSQRFRRLDLNQDGKLTKEEFADPLFDQIDTNKDGIITAEEDQAFVKRRAAATGQPGQSPVIPDSVKAELDIPYAATENPRQCLDLYLPKRPKTDKPLPIVVFIHGGGWQNGDKRGGFATIRGLVMSGDYAGVSVGYRLTNEAIWPVKFTIARRQFAGSKPMRKNIISIPIELASRVHRREAILSRCLAQAATWHRWKELWENISIRTVASPASQISMARPTC